MEKQKLIYGTAALLLVLVFVLVAALNNANTPPGPTSVPGSTESTAPTNTPTMPEKEKVIIYQCTPEKAAIWQKMAQAYSAQTGEEVQIITESGNCGDMLPELLAGDKAPAVFCLHGTASIGQLGSYCKDLTGSALLEQLCSNQFALQTQKGIWGIASQVESYGLIYNASLLARAGYTDGDIRDLTTLRNIVKHITAEQKELGFAAFATPNLTDTSHGGQLCLLAGLTEEEADLRQFWDLYINNNAQKMESLAGAEDDAGLQDFLQGRAVFFLGGTWVYQQFAQMKDYDLRMLPVYTDDSQDNMGLYSACTGYWCINGQASAIVAQKAEAFLLWMVSGQEDGGAPVDALQMMSPYKGAAYYSNPLEERVREYMQAELTGVQWRNCDTIEPQALQDFGSALQAYALKPDDETWAQVALRLEQTKQ